MELFKGYIVTKNKRATTKWKNQKLKTLDEVKDEDEYAGVLARDTILLDVDNGTQSAIIAKIVQDLKIKCKIIQTTRGRHFYFKNDGKITNCKTNVRLACGLDADFKIGLVNSYAVLKYGGADRFVELDFDEYDFLPYFLRPVKGQKLDFLNMKEGDGRNSAIFGYILTLQRNGFTTEQSRETITILNEYVLEQKLDDDEIASITRDDAFKQPAFFEKSKFLHDRFAEFLIEEEHIIKLNGQLHIYVDGVYVASRKKIELAMIRHIPAIKDAQRREVLKYLDVYLPNTIKFLEARYIAFNNGILDIVTDTMLDFSPEILVTNKIDFNYDSEAFNELVENTLNKLSCNDKNVRALIEESAGYCLYRRNELGKCFLYLGDASNGKSTFLDMVKTMLGSENISALDMQELGDRFNTAMMYNKLANIGDDISDDFMKGREISTFKKIVTGNRIKGEMKGQDPFEFEPYVKLLFSANVIPRTKDTTGAVMRRLIIVPFKAKFSQTDSDYDPFIKYKLCEDSAIEYLLALSVKALRRILINKGFTECSEVKIQLREYELENNPVLAFISEKGFKYFEGRNVKETYLAYCDYCLENKYKALSKILFGKQLRKKLNLKTEQITIRGRAENIYKKI